MRSTIHEADLVACRLASSLTRWVVVVSRVALQVFEERAWSRWGFSSKRDFCVERLGVSSRQFELWVEAARMFSRFPALADAVVGDDGGAPLGLCKGRWVGKRADEESLAAWIALAREKTYRQLQLIKETPESESEARSRWSIPTPEALGRAFEAGLLLHRKLSGSEASVANFVEMLVADAVSEGTSWDSHVESVESVDPRTVVEERMARVTNNWNSLPAVVAAKESLARFEDAAALEEPLEALERLCSLQHELELRLGEVLCEMSQHGAWPQMLFTCVGHYSVERLGLSRTSMEGSARLHRRLKRLPLLRQAYVAGASPTRSGVANNGDVFAPIVSARRPAHQAARMFSHCSGGNETPCAFRASGRSASRRIRGARQSGLSVWRAGVAGGHVEHQT